MTIPTDSPTTQTVPLRDLSPTNVLNNGSGKAPDNELIVTDLQHVGHDWYILDVEDVNGRASSFPPLSGGVKCQKVT